MTTDERLHAAQRIVDTMIRELRKSLAEAETDSASPDPVVRRQWLEDTLRQYE